MTEQSKQDLPTDFTIADFYWLLTKRKCVFVPLPNSELWPAASVDERVPWPYKLDKDGIVARDENGDPIRIKPSKWIARNQAIDAMTWIPGEPKIVIDRMPDAGGLVSQLGARVLNTYRPPPERGRGRADGAGPWLDLVRKLYPDDAEDIVTYMAHCLQFPGVKINHALVLAGAPGIGKDSIIEPLVRGVGAANFKEVSPKEILTSPYNDYLCGVVLRVSEAKDQGEINRYALYEAMKTMLAAPPHMHRINVKFVPQYYAANVVNVIVTTNYERDGLYLPGDDRRHRVASAGPLMTPACFEPDCFPRYHAWQESGGADDVVAYLQAYDISKFQPKAPPKKTPAFWVMVNAGIPPEVAELNDAIDKLGRTEKPPAVHSVTGEPCGPGALTLTMLRGQASTMPDLHEWLADRKNRRTLPHRLAACGYLAIPNSTQSELWRINDKRQAVYGRCDLTPDQRYAAAEALKQRLEQAAADLSTGVTPLVRRSGKDKDPPSK
jgi:hypothetical protein